MTEDLLTPEQRRAYEERMAARGLADMAEPATEADSARQFVGVDGDSEPVTEAEG